MWIERLEIDGFGTLRGPYELSRGLTLVTGPNEAGKSTLHRAILKSLFGFTRAERRRGGGSSALMECAPWTGPAFGLESVLHTEARVLRATWTFDEDESSQALSLIDEHTGDDLTAEVAQRRGDYALGRYLMGLDYGEFCQVCMLEQAAIGGVKRSDPLVEALRRAVEMGAAEHGVDEASDLLGNALGSAQIGVRRDNLAPLPTGLLKASENRAGELETALERAEVTRESLRELAVELEDQGEREGRVLAQRSLTQQQLLLSRAADLAERTKMAEDAMARADYVPDPSVELASDEADAVIALFAQHDRLQGQLARNEPSAGAAREVVERVGREAAEVNEKLHAVDAYRVIDASQGHAVRDLLARIEEIDRDTAEAPPADSSGGLHPAWIAAAGAAVASLVAAAVVSPAALVGLIGAAALAWFASRQAVGRTPIAVGPERRAELDRDLTVALDRAEAPLADNLLIRAKSYLDACDKRARFDSLTATQLEFERRAVEAGKPETEQRRLNAEREDVEIKLRERLSNLEIEVADLKSARRAFDDRVDAALKDLEERARAEGAAEALDVALGGLTLDQLRAERDTAQQSLREHRAQHGDLTSAPGDQDVLQRRLTDLAQEAEVVAGETGRLEALIAEKEQELAPVPGMREELEALIERIDRIRVAAEAIEIGRTVLKQAASESHRRFAPHLNDAIAKDLPTITRGRYTTARINEELQMTLVAPETGDPVDVSVLSRGTQDQIYLIERLAILGMLVPGGVMPPLLLDDVFVHFDPERTRFGVEVLAREAECRQVVLFAGDSKISATLNQLGLDHQEIALERPA